MARAMRHRALVAALLVAPAVGLGSGCAAKRAFKVPPCLVPHHDSEGAKRSFWDRFTATPFLEPIIEDHLFALYGNRRVHGGHERKEALQVQGIDVAGRAQRDPR